MWSLKLHLFCGRTFLKTRPFCSVAIPRIARIAVPQKMEIRLTESENRLCTLLDECTIWMKEERGLEKVTKEKGMNSRKSSKTEDSITAGVPMDESP